MDWLLSRLKALAQILGLLFAIGFGALMLLSLYRMAFEDFMWLATRLWALGRWAWASLTV